MEPPARQLPGHGQYVGGTDVGEFRRRSRELGNGLGNGVGLGHGNRHGHGKWFVLPSLGVQLLLRNDDLYPLHGQLVEPIWIPILEPGCNQRAVLGKSPGYLWRRREPHRHFSLGIGIAGTAGHNGQLPWDFVGFGYGVFACRSRQCRQQRRFER